LQEAQHMIKFGYTILYVENVEATISFYEKAFGLVQKFITPEKDYGELETGETKLAFAQYSVAEFNGITIAKSNATHVPPALEVTFVVSDVENAFKKAIDAGAQIVKAPSQKPWGQIVAYVRDNNGFLVELCTAMEG